MRQNALLTILLFLVVSPGVSQAQGSAVIAAQRQDMEESQRRLNARIGALEEALQAYQHEISSLKSEIRSVREELARARNKNEAAATDESIKRLAASIEEVDKKRMADNEKILAKFRELGRELGKQPPPIAKNRPNREVDPPLHADKTFEYTIREGDTLSAIVKSLRDQGFNVTRDQIEKANPKAKWNSLGVGKKIFIPAPPP